MLGCFVHIVVKDVNLTDVQGPGTVFANATKAMDAGNKAVFHKD